MAHARRGMCMLMADPPGGGPPSVLQAGQNTLWVSGTPFSGDGARHSCTAHAGCGRAGGVSVGCAAFAGEAPDGGSLSKCSRRV